MLKPLLYKKPIVNGRDMLLSLILVGCLIVGMALFAILIGRL